MFEVANAFNQPLANWDVSKGTTFQYMFREAYVFNQPIENWDVSKGANFRYMFSQANVFSQPLENWDVSQATTVVSVLGRLAVYLSMKECSYLSFSLVQQYMFYLANAFNQPLANWDVSKGTDFTYMFASTPAFDQDLSSWVKPTTAVVRITTYSYLLLCCNPLTNVFDHDRVQCF
jgi:hypothetical protein